MMIIAWLLGAALSASAHELYPIRPVRATVRVEPDRIVADVRADSIIWIEEVTGLKPMPAQNWPAEVLSKVEAYVNTHFLIAADGRPLAGKLAEARYRQFPWEVNEQGTFFLRMVYPPAPAGSTLTCAAQFYSEYRKEVQAEFAGRPLPDADEYRTLVSIPGRKKIEIILRTDSAPFNFTSDDARRSSFAMALESFRRGAEAAFGTAILLASAMLGFVGARLFNAPPWMIWAGTLGASLSAGRRRLALAASVAAAYGLGLTWAGVAGSTLPHSRLAAPFALAGTLAAGAALLCVIWLGVRAEYRRLATISQSRVDELFARRARLTATALAMVGAYGLWQSLQR
ncbi:MAG: hypothetical protein ABL955_13375 [Elusimicrobiota bacterium]